MCAAKISVAVTQIIQDEGLKQYADAKTDVVSEIMSHATAPRQS